MLDYKAALSLPQAINAMLSKLDALISEVRALRSEEPTPRPENRVPLLILSNLGSVQARTPSTEFHITGIFIGGDTSGRGTLQIGTWQIPFWVTSNVTVFYRLSEDDQLVVKDDRITWNPPGGTNWDVILMGHNRKSDRAYKAIQSSKGPGGRDA